MTDRRAKALGPETAPPRVTVIYPFVAHYRLGVFRAMEADPDVAYNFVSGLTAHEFGIPVIGVKQLPTMRIVRNLWVGPVLFQPFALRHALTADCDVTILVGDVKFLSTWMAAAILRIRKRKVLFWTIGWHRPETGFKRLARLAFYRLANGLLIYGGTAKAIGEQMGYPVARMHVVGNSHEPDTSPIDTAEPDYRLSAALERSTVVGAIIRPSPNKRLDLLLSAVASLRERGSDIGVLVVGEGSCRNTLEQMAIDLGIPADFPGAIHSPHALARIYQSILVTVVPEAIGLTAVQSLWHGRPVITCDDPYRQMPEHECVRPGITGDLYRTGDVESLAKVIEKWVARMDLEKATVETACRNEVEAHWTSRAHALRIAEAVRRQLSL